MKRAGLIVLTIFLCLFSLAVHAAPVGTFNKVSGRVDLTRDGAPARPVHKGDAVTVGDIIRAKSNAKAEIVFVDESILRIAQKSRVKISDYTVEKGQKSGVFNLFRGKIENVVKKSGGLFGFKKKSKFEVHTITAVCGVRGTDFFSMHQGGLSSFIFKEGQGYGYTKNRPNEIVDIVAGQAMLVARPDLPPIVRPARPEEIARHAEDTAAGENGEDDGDDREDQKVDEAAGDKQGDDTSKDQQKGDDGAKEENGGNNQGKDDQQGDQDQADQDSEGDVPEDRKPGDDEPSDPEPVSRESGDHKQGDDDRGDDRRGDGKRQYYARTDDRSGDDGEDKTFRPGDRGDRRREDDRRGEYYPRGDRRDDRRPADYGPKNDRRSDYGPGEERQGNYRGEGPPPQGEDYSPYDPPPPGDDRHGDYRGEGPPPGEDHSPYGPPPPGGDYGPYGPPPPGNHGLGDYRGERPPPPGDDYGPYCPPPPGNYGPGDYRVEGPPPPGGDYGPYGPPPDNFKPLSYGGGGPPPLGGNYSPYGPPPAPGDFFGGPGEFYAGDFGPGDYWGEGPPLGGNYGPYGPPPVGGEFYMGDFGPGDFFGDDFFGDDFFGDDFFGDNFFFDPDMHIDIEDFLKPPFSVDSISISGNAGDTKFSLSMQGYYEAPPPFMYMYEEIRGELGGDLKSGYFYGFTNCEWKYGVTEVRGTGVFFYIDSDDDTGGMIVGELSGSYSAAAPYDWSASGSLDWVALGTGLTVPVSVAAITDYPRDIEFVSGSDTGNFDIYRNRGIFDSIEEEQYWGFWENHIDATYSTMVDNWSLEWEQEGTECDAPEEMNLLLYMSANGTTGDRNVEGDIAGGWVDIEHAVTGIAVGDLHGGYDPYSKEIFAGGGGPWLGTSKLLTMAGTIDGRADLTKMKIPCYSIGTATLTGSGGNITALTLTDVTFLAHSAGGIPRIWATDSIAGTNAAGGPAVGTTVGLTQLGAGTNAAGLSANFNVRTWDTTSNIWSATITDGAGTVGGNSVTFEGGAGGKMTAPTTFGGTAAGWAK